MDANAVGIIKHSLRSELVRLLTSDDPDAVAFRAALRAAVTAPSDDGDEGE